MTGRPRSRAAHRRAQPVPGGARAAGPRRSGRCARSAAERDAGRGPGATCCCGSSTRARAWSARSAPAWTCWSRCRAGCCGPTPRASPFTDKKVEDGAPRLLSDGAPARDRGPRSLRGPPGGLGGLHRRETRFEPLRGGRPGGPATTTCVPLLAAPVIGEDGLLGVLQAGHRDARRVRRGRASGSSCSLAGLAFHRRDQRPPVGAAGRLAGARSSGPRTASARCARSPAG